MAEGRRICSGQVGDQPQRQQLPALPIREGENVFVWLSQFADETVWARHRRVLTRVRQWRAAVGALSLWTHQPIERLRLQPTVRSRLQVITAGGMK